MESPHPSPSRAAKDLPTTTQAPDYRVAVVDDHTIMRDGIRMFLGRLHGFVFAWEAEDAMSAMRLLESDPPEILITEIALPGRNGLELLKDVQCMCPSIRILVWSMYDERLYAHRALKAGAKGYLTKNAPNDQLAEALRRIARGGYSFSEETAKNIFASFTKGSKHVEKESGLESLTDREFEVFQLIGAAKNTKEISEELHISTKTVDVHRSNMRSKLHIPDSATLSRYAIRWVESRERD